MRTNYHKCELAAPANNVYMRKRVLKSNEYRDERYVFTSLFLTFFIIYVIIYIEKNKRE